VGQSLFTAAAEDFDCFDSGALDYRIANQNPAFPVGLFAINGTTGEVTVATSLRVTGANSTTYSLGLTVRDAGGQITSSSAIVTVVDVNNFAPVFVSLNNGTEYVLVTRSLFECSPSTPVHLLLPPSHECIIFVRVHEHHTRRVPFACSCVRHGRTCLLPTFHETGYNILPTAPTLLTFVRNAGTLERLTKARQLERQSQRCAPLTQILGRMLQSCTKSQLPPVLQALTSRSII
jgi:hypothetical protein